MTVREGTPAVRRRRASRGHRRAGGGPRDAHRLGRDRAAELSLPRRRRLSLVGRARCPASPRAWCGSPRTTAWSASASPTRVLRARGDVRDRRLLPARCCSARTRATSPRSGSSATPAACTGVAPASTSRSSRPSSPRSGTSAGRPLGVPVHQLLGGCTARSPSGCMPAAAWIRPTTGFGAEQSSMSPRATRPPRSGSATAPTATSTRSVVAREALGPGHRSRGGCGAGQQPATVGRRDRDRSRQSPGALRTDLARGAVRGRRCRGYRRCGPPWTSRSPAARRAPPRADHRPHRAGLLRNRPARRDPHRRAARGAAGGRGRRQDARCRSRCTCGDAASA